MRGSKRQNKSLGIFIDVNETFRKSMSFYRGSNALAVEEELATIVDSIEKKQNKGRTITDLLKQLSGPSFRKPYSCIGILDMTYKFAGLNTVSYYAEEFMDDVGAGLWKPAEDDPETNPEDGFR